MAEVERDRGRNTGIAEPRDEREEDLRLALGALGIAHALAGVLEADRVPALRDGTGGPERVVHRLAGDEAVGDASGDRRNHGVGHRTALEVLVERPGAQHVGRGRARIGRRRAGTR